MASLTEFGNMQQARRRTSGTPLRLDDMTSAPAAGGAIAPVKPAASLSQGALPKPTNPVAGYQQNVQQNRQALGDVAGKVGDFYKGAATGLMTAASVVPRTALGLATGETKIGIDSNLPDYGAGERQRAAQKFVTNNPRQAASANEFAAGAAGRAVGRIQERLATPLDMGEAELPSGALTPLAQPRQPAGQPAAPASNPAGSSVQPSALQGLDDVLPRKADASEYGMAAPGIAARRGEGGVMEFTDSPGALGVASGRKTQAGGIGNGVGGLSVVSGGGEARARNDLSVAYMQQARREQGNSNYLNVVRDSNASGVKGIINREKNESAAQQFGERRAQGLARIDEGKGLLTGLQSQLDQNVQARIANERNNRSAGRLDDLSSALANPNLPAERRAQLERTMGSLTVSAKDRYVPQDTILDYDPEGKPIVGRTALDVLSGNLVGQEARQAGTNLTSQGMMLAGTYQGKKVYRDANGQLFVDD